MGQLKHLIIHCSATREGQAITADQIRRWHMGPKNNDDGSVTYLGKKFKNREALPFEKVGGMDIKLLKGRGWSRPGYRKMFHINGSITDLQEWNNDDWIDAGEITNGAKGFNGTSEHFMYVGGCDQNLKPKDTRTPEQLLALEVFVLNEIELHPKILVGGHNQISSKACPSFDVPKWLREIGVSDMNIYGVNQSNG